MSFNYDPNAVYEPPSFLMQPGEYPFVVHDYTIGTSKSGNAMITLKLKFIKDGVPNFVWDYLVNTPSMLFKAKHFCEAVGIEEDYLSGNLEPSAKWLGLAGFAKVEIQPAKEKEEGNPAAGYYSEKNIIKDYIKRDNMEQIKADELPQDTIHPAVEDFFKSEQKLSTSKRVEIPFDDEIPF